MAKFAWLLIFLMVFQMSGVPTQVKPWMRLEARAMDDENQYGNVKEFDLNHKLLWSGISYRRLNGQLACIGIPCPKFIGTCGDFCICSEPVRPIPKDGDINLMKNNDYGGDEDDDDDGEENICKEKL